MVLYDLAKAFDTVNHSILLKVLNKIGVRGLAGQLMQSYLSNRKQNVRVNGIYSENETVICGVPQGTILGPILFIIYLTEILTTLSELVSYADDTALLRSGNSWKDVFQIAQQRINETYRLLCKYKLSLNISKTHYIAFGNYADSIPATKDKELHT